MPRGSCTLSFNLVNDACYAVSQKRKTLGPGYAPTIQVRTRSQGDAVEVRICDNGTGIPPKVLEKIFDPFFTTKPPGEGTGLGLSISHDIVHGHHREIRVDTRDDEYTEFIVVLPRKPPREAG